MVRAEVTRSDSTFGLSVDLQITFPDLPEQRFLPDEKPSIVPDTFMNNLQTGKPHQVLLLDQDASVRDLMAEVLRDENYLVPDHDYSLDTDVIQDLQPDLIVLDLPKNSHGPQLDFVQGVKAHARTAHIPILGLCRLMPVNDYCAWMSQTGIARLLHKPFDLDDFLDAVRSCIESVHLPTMARQQQTSMHQAD